MKASKGYDNFFKGIFSKNKDNTQKNNQHNAYT